MPGTTGTSNRDTVAFAVILSPMVAIAADRRADEHDAGVVEGGREFRVLREEPVTRMYRLRAGAHRGVDDGGDVEVALPGRCRAEQHGGVGLGDVAGAGVGLAVDGHRSDAHLPQRPDDPDRDLAAVGDQNGVEKGRTHRSLTS